MHNALNPQELLYAQRLQRRGLLLREIAAELDVSFQAVCLALYGGNEATRQSEEAVDATLTVGIFGRRDGENGPADAARPVAENADEAGACVQPSVAEGEDRGHAITVREESAASPAAESDRPAEPSREQAAPAAILSPSGVSASVGDAPVRSADLAEQPDSAIEAERLDLSRRFHPAQRFRLVSDDGQALHQSLHVLTRLPSFYWRGTAEQLAAVRRRRPQWAHLKPVAVTS